MTKFILRFVISVLAVLAASYLIPGVYIQDIVAAILLVIVLGVLNAIIRPILVVLTLPVTLLTLGLFYFVINAFIIILASHIVPGFQVDGLINAFLFSLIISVIQSFLTALSK